MLSSTKMLFYGNIVVEKHCGADGLIISTFSLRNEECLCLVTSVSDAERSLTTVSLSLTVLDIALIAKRSVLLRTKRKFQQTFVNIVVNKMVCCPNMNM